MSNTFFQGRENFSRGASPSQVTRLLIFQLVEKKPLMFIYANEKLFTQYCSIYTFTATKKDADVSSVGAGNLLGMQRIYCPYFPKFVRKTFMRQTFSRQIFFRCCCIIFSSTKLP